jgi:translation initiation factor IF-3
MMHRERGHQRMKDIIAKLEDVGKLEMPPRQNGRRLTMMLAPDKAKIEQIKRREASQAVGSKDAEHAPPPEDVADATPQPEVAADATPPDRDGARDAVGTSSE